MGAAVQIEVTRREQREDILAVARRAILFSEEEIATVQELIDDFIGRGPQASGYHFLSCIVDGKVVGFACYGPRALTSGTFDLYWIAVDGSLQGRGLGAALSERAAQDVKRLGGRLIVAETSGKPEYAPTRGFYEKHGYAREATIADFYAPGDDMVVYVMRL